MSLSEEQKGPSREGTPCALAPAVGLREKSEWSRRDFRRDWSRKVSPIMAHIYIVIHKRMSLFCPWVQRVCQELLSALQCTSETKHTRTHQAIPPSGARFKCDS